MQQTRRSSAKTTQMHGGAVDAEEGGTGLDLKTDSKQEVQTEGYGQSTRSDKQSKRKCGTCYCCAHPQLGRACVVHGVSERSRKSQKRRLLSIELLSKESAERSSSPAAAISSTLHTAQQNSATRRTVRRSGPSSASAVSASITEERSHSRRSWKKQRISTHTLLDGEFSVHSWAPVASTSTQHHAKRQQQHASTS